MSELERVDTGVSLNEGWTGDGPCDGSSSFQLVLERSLWRTLVGIRLMGRDVQSVCGVTLVRIVEIF